VPGNFPLAGCASPGTMSVWSDHGRGTDMTWVQRGLVALGVTVVALLGTATAAAAASMVEYAL